MANPSPQHNPTDGLGTATTLILTGTGVTAVTVGSLYKVALSLSGTNTVALAAAIKDIGANAFVTGNGNAASWKSYNTNVATVVAGTVTAVALGMAVIEVRFPTSDVDATKDGNDFIYATIHVTVGA